MENKFLNFYHKKVIIPFFLFSSLFIQAQSKEFLILDSITNKPINLVHFSYPDFNIGSISNTDGKVTIPLKKSNLVISHINYKNRLLAYSDFSQKDTIYLLQRNTELDEIVVYNINLKDRIQKVLKAIKKNYQAKNTIHNTTYKEAYSIDNSLSRLFQIQMDWWSKNSLYNFKKTIEKQNRFVLENIDYSKTIPFSKNSSLPNGGYIENNSFFRFVHLNYLLTLIQKHSKNIVIHSLVKEGNQVDIIFDATLYQNKRKLFEYQKSRIVFDTTYTKIKFIKLNMKYDIKLKRGISTVENLPYQRAITSHTVTLSFDKTNTGKMTLNYFISEIKGFIRYKGSNHQFSSNQSLFVTGTIFNKKLKTEKILNLSKPFYKSFKNEKPTYNAKILLTNVEKFFLDKE